MTCCWSKTAPPASAGLPAAQFLDADVAELHGGAFGLKAKKAAPVFEAGDFPGALTVAPESDVIADRQNAPLIPLTDRFLKRGNGIAPLASAHQLADRRLRQIDLVRLDLPAAPDEESAIILLAHRAPLKTNVKVGEFALRCQVRVVASRELDHTLVDLPVGRKGLGRGDGLAEPPAGEVLAVEERDEPCFCLLVTERLGLSCARPQSAGTHDDPRRSQWRTLAHRIGPFPVKRPPSQAHNRIPLLEHTRTETPVPPG